MLILLRHSVRDELPPGAVGYVLPITRDGRHLARELGGCLRGRLRTLRTSPLIRCVQTAEALREGAAVEIPIVADRNLGDPGVFVVDDQLADETWRKLGHEAVMHHLVSHAEALPGLARPNDAARSLVAHMFEVAANESGIHVFVTHDSLVTAAAARLLGVPLGPAEWPKYLEGAFFWRQGDAVVIAYRERQGQRAVTALSARGQ